MPADRADLAGAAAASAREIEAVLADPPRLDYVILGVGPDGHVASLFPGHAALGETSRPTVAVLDAPAPPAARLTLTLPMLVGAGRVVVMALDASKAPVVGSVLEGDGSTLPVSMVVRRTARPLLLLDASAAPR
jgi:6-phosphogluconolactonase